jgi:hypothetical protein
MCESIVVVGAALSADVDAPTERVHSAPGARRGQSAKQPTGERAGRENTEEFRVTSVIRPRLDWPFQRELIRSQHSIESC